LKYNYNKSDTKKYSYCAYMRKPYDLIPTKYISTINNIIEEYKTLGSNAVPATLTLRLADANK
ncbi:hypothetical protein EG327_003643, partial [Venturia inaequalis]